MRVNDWYKEKLGYRIIGNFLNTLSSLDAASCSPARKTPKIQPIALLHKLQNKPLNLHWDQKST